MLELLIYNLFVKLYHWAIRIASCWNKKAKLWALGRKNVFSLIQEKINPTQERAWFHCASLGEFEQARPVLESFREYYPDFQIVLTFYSPSGYEVKKNYPKADVISYLPEDNPQNAKKFLDLVSPSLICWTKYEFWYHYLNIAHQKNIPIILFSAIFRENQLFFRKSVQLYRKMLHFFTHIFVQDEASLCLLQKIQIQHCSLVKDTRFDRVWQIAQQLQEIDLVRHFKNNQPLLIVGSAWGEDWQVISQFLRKWHKPLKVIIAPHEISIHRLKSIEKDCGKVVFFTQIDKTKNIEDFNFLVVDTVGHLSALYRYADFAWIGGAFKQGLHNILEAAVFGMPIFFGDKAYQKFNEAKELINLQGAFPFGNADSLLEAFTELYENTNLLEEKKQITRKYIQDNIGGSKKIIQKINETICETKRQ